MAKASESITPEETKEDTSLMRVIGWFSVGVAVAAVGILVGRELRNRSRFNHRTPYDFYEHADECEFGEFGVGV